MSQNPSTDALKVKWRERVGVRGHGDGREASCCLSLSSARPAPPQAGSEGARQRTSSRILDHVQSSCHLLCSLIYISVRTVSSSTGSSTGSVCWAQASDPLEQRDPWKHSLGPRQLHCNRCWYSNLQASSTKHGCSQTRLSSHHSNLSWRLLSTWARHCDESHTCVASFNSDCGPLRKKLSLPLMRRGENRPR